MSFEEIGVIGLCLFAGYWGVSFLFDRRKRESPGVPPTLETAAPSAEAGLPSPLPWTTVLGVSPDASIEQIQRAYQMRTAELRLDTAVALGAQAQAVAKRKSREIVAAYDQACRARRARA